MKSIGRATAAEWSRQRDALLKEHCIHFDQLVFKSRLPHTIEHGSVPRHISVEYDVCSPVQQAISLHMRDKGYHVYWTREDFGFVATLKKF